MAFLMNLPILIDDRLIDRSRQVEINISRNEAISFIASEMPCLTRAQAEDVLNTISVKRINGNV